MTDHDRIRAALPGYRIGDLVGRGGCGEVLMATHDRLQRTVAIKQIPPQLATDPAVRRRFAAEARLMASIDHPHVVPVYDYVECDNLCLLVMEYLPGGTVASRFATQGFDAASALAISLACAAGLEAAHRRGVLHRDIKPANLMFTQDGTVKLTDFGIAKIVGGDETMVTRAGEVVGTPSYIAPEQARGQQVSPATDIYALATMLYQLLSGVLPYPHGEDSMATLFMHAFEEPTPLTEAARAVPESIADVVMRGLATDPADRFPSAESFGVALAEGAGRCWGADWLNASGVTVIGADAIVAATRTGEQAAVSGASGHVPRHKVQPTATSIRPAQTLPRARVALSDIPHDELTPVRQVVKLRSPRLPAAVAALLAMVAIAIPLLGIGAAAPARNRVPGVVTVAGVDPAVVDGVNVDMSKPIPLTVHAADGDTVALAMTILGTTVFRSQAPLVSGDRGLTATIAPPVSPYLLAGTTGTELHVLRNGNTVATYPFVIRSVQSPFTTALAICTAIVGLFSCAYAESYSRALRRGDDRVTAVLGLTMSAAGLGLTVTAAAWVALGHQPTVTSLVTSVAVAAAAGLASAVAGRRAGEAIRLRRGRSRRLPQRLGAAP